MADDNGTRLRNVLAALFMFDFAELDFGIYRIMNAKRQEIAHFLDNDLLPQVRAELDKVESGEHAGIAAELEQAIEKARELDVDPETIPKVQTLRAKLAKTINPAGVEEDIYSHLATFFRRYYKEGDYLSLRRYKKDVYALPYEGEEVKLHWANADQYYIKSSEYFRDYAFKLPDGRRVRFKLVEANSEQNNNKASNGRERRFVLVEKQALAEQGEELMIRFDYRQYAEKQATLNQAAVDRIMAEVAANFPGWLNGLSANVSTDKEPQRTLLEKHLTDYTARNSFDYFIHKDLRTFLRRELDFYIKNEVMLLDDIEEEITPRVEHYLAKVRAIRRIAHKVIDMLAQVEDFQKKLWLKKKFVVETNYCVTLDRVPEELYPEIAANDAQREEWVHLFALDELVNTTISPNYSVPLTVDFLKANPFLVLDTRFFSQHFKNRLLASFDDLDAQLDGLLVHSENFHALNLLLERYREQVNCIYIDPPYNTDSAPILYKNDYKHSSWISLMNDRMRFSTLFLTETGVKIIAIDDTEVANLSKLLEDTLAEYRLTRVTVIHNPKGSITKDFNRVHEYVIFLTHEQDNSAIARTLEQNETPRKMRRWGENSLRIQRPRSFYPVYVKDGKITRIGEVPPDDFSPGKKNILLSSGEIEIWPIDQEGVERRWNFGLESIEENIERITVRAVDNELDLFLTHELTVPKTVWTGGEYDAGAYGNTLLINILGSKMFDFPKSIHLVRRCISLPTSPAEKNTVLDYFAGSGTTAHAVINLNREDGGQRKYILVEMGEYFHTVLKPRILKVLYSKDWKHGKPVSRVGSGHMLKYIRLESYEDALNNLELRRDELQTELLQEEPHLREDYMLRYMLDIESRGSASLLNIAAFDHPFNYTLKIANGSVGETRDTAVDLVETFNYLLGLRVQKYQAINGIVTVQGNAPDGQRVVIIWRDVEQTDNMALDEFFQQQGFANQSKAFDLVYVNGDNNLENMRRDDETWTVRLIEEEFQRLMFDVQNI